MVAFDAKTGEQVWEFKTDAGVNAAPVAYEVDGKQYISVLVGGNALAGSKHGDSLWTFSLDGTIESGADVASTDKQNENKGEAGATANAGEGKTVFEGNCLACHGREGTGGHNGPDLQLSQVAKDSQKVIERVKKGGTVMPFFGDLLSDQQVQDVAAYITQVVAKKRG